MLKVKNLTLGYGNTTVIKNLSFQVNQGDFLCIVGHNGAGKTTLIRGILGLLTPEKGEIKFQGLLPTEIGFMPQETKIDPNFPATVSEIVLSGLLGKKRFYSKDDKRKAEEKLALLNLADLKTTRFQELSGGQKQKVLLARALMASEKLLVLDEPSNNLDQTSKTGLYEIIKQLNQTGLTIIMITHDLDHDNLLGNKILALGDSETFFGATADYIRKVHHE